MGKKRHPLTVLKSIREQRGNTQAELAKELLVTPQYYSALERGLNELTYYDAYLIARKLGMPPDALFMEDAIERLRGEEKRN